MGLFRKADVSTRWIGTDSLEEVAKSINSATARLVEAARQVSSQLVPERPSQVKPCQDEQTNNVIVC